MKVTKVGDDFAVLLPADVVAKLGLAVGDEVEVQRVPKASEEELPERLKLLYGLRKYRGLIPADYKFKREDCYEPD